MGDGIQGTLSWESRDMGLHRGPGIHCDLGHVTHLSWASVSPYVDQEFKFRVSEVPSRPD